MENILWTGATKVWACQGISVGYDFFHHPDWVDMPKGRKVLRDGWPRNKPFPVIPKGETKGIEEI